MPTTKIASHSTRKHRRPSKRQTILEAAVELYASCGFRGTSLAAIGERAGVTHAAVLYHFGSAEGILLAVIEERDQRVKERYTQMFTGGPLETLARLPEIASFNVANLELTRLHTVLAAESINPQSPVHDWFKRRSRIVHRMYAKCIKEGVATGELRADVDAEQEASAIIAFMEGAQLQHFLEPERVDLIALFEGYSRKLISDLSA